MLRKPLKEKSQIEITVCVDHWISLKNKYLIRTSKVNEICCLVHTKRFEILKLRFRLVEP